MAIAIKSLGDGQLGASAALYTCPASTTAVVKLITLVNTDAVSITVNIQIKPSGGTARCIIPKDMSMTSGYLSKVDDSITLEAGDAIWGDASISAKVDYTISGIERV